MKNWTLHHDNALSEFATSVPKYLIKWYIKIISPSLQYRSRNMWFLDVYDVELEAPDRKFYTNSEIISAMQGSL